jgi:hypothetical protein
MWNSKTTEPPFAGRKRRENRVLFSTVFAFWWYDTTLAKAITMTYENTWRGGH